MKKRILCLALLLPACLSIQGQQRVPREMVLFDNGWKFHPGHASDPQKDFNFTISNIFSKSGKAENTAIDPKSDDSGWRTVQLPHDWVVELPFVYSPDFDVQSHGYKPVGGLFPETSVGWYRKHFTVPASDSGLRYSVRFDGVFRDAQFWLNGFYLGRNESGYIGVSYDITDYISFSKDNVLAVRVDASQYEGWFYEGAGIYRHVWLTKTGNLHIAENGVFVYSEVSGNAATIIFESTVRNDFAVSSSCAIVSRVTDREGGAIATTDEQMVSAHPVSSVTAVQRLVIDNPRKWSTDDPYLYRATVILRNGRQAIDSITLRFGIRTVRFDADSGFFLNNVNIKIRGVCCHQDHAGVGSALPDFLQYYRISLLKEMGINAYRASHNAPTPELLDACDSLGMLVVDEQRLLNSSPEYMDQFERLILRDRSHPSVILWSIGNEEGYIQTTGTGKRIALSLLTKQKELDPTRTCTYAADLPNVFTGINEVIPVRGFNYRQFAVADYHASHPDQPLVGTEMGSTVTTRGCWEKDTIRCYLPDQDITAPWWASRAEEWWKLCAAQPSWMGGFIWTGLDYRGEPTPFQWPNINSHFGVMDMCGFPKNIYYYYQSWWTDKDVLHISPHWNWPGREGDTVNVWINSNAETVQLFLNDRSLGKKEMPRNGHLEWEVPYQPGTLEAVAFKAGRKITSRVETTGNPAQVVLNPAKSVIISNGTDGTVINVTVKDLQGRDVPDAGNLIRFKVKGDAAFIGVGNGNPSSHEQDKCQEGQWQRTLFNGKCQLILRSGTTSGPIVIEGDSEGLTTGSLIIQTTKR